MRIAETRYEKPDPVFIDFFAFERSRAEGKVLLTQEEVHDKKRRRGQYKIEEFNIAEYFPKAVDALKKASIALGSIPALRAPTVSTSFPPLISHFETDDTNVSVESQLYYGEGHFISRIKIYSSKVNEKIVYSAPSLGAVAETFKAPFDEAYLYLVADSLPKFRASTLFSDKNFFSKQFVIPASPDTKMPSVFVVTQPITVTTSSGSFCVGVVSYSPVPLSFNDDYYCSGKK